MQFTIRVQMWIYNACDNEGKLCFFLWYTPSTNLLYKETDLGPVVKLGQIIKNGFKHLCKVFPKMTRSAQGKLKMPVSLEEVQQFIPRIKAWLWKGPYLEEISHLV